MKFDKNVNPCLLTEPFDPDAVKQIPARLADLPYWCCWNWTWYDKNGRWTKTPYSPKTGKAARSNHPEDYAPMADALTHQKRANQSGIGIALFGDVAAIDLDECLPDLSPDNEAIVQLLHSYTEISPSGTGLHILFRVNGVQPDKERYYTRYDKYHRECYLSSQYMTVTGNVFRDMTDFGDRTAEFRTFLDRYMQRETMLTEGHTVQQSQPLGGSLPVGMSALSDTEVIAKASTAKNGEKFAKLWNGDISDYATADCTGYSEADEALLCMLAYWTRKDEAQTERLFLQSGLCREKTTEQRGYLSRSMKKAFARVQTVYDPNYRSGAWEDFSPPAPVKVTGGQPQQTRPEWPEFTPLTNADAIADQMPDFPVDAFPPVQREYVLAVAKQMKADPCMVAAGVLASGASAIQGVIDFSPRKGWNTNGTEATPLWVLSIMESGGGKSRVNNEIRSHIDEWQKQLNKKMQNAIADSEANLKFANAEMKRLMSAQQRAKSGEEDCVTAQRIREAERKVKDAEKKVIHPVTLTCGNCTSERLLEMMRDQYFHRITVITSEGGVLKTWAGKYSDGRPDVSTQCNAYMGEHAEENRRCSLDRVVDEAYLSVMIYGQWNVLADAMTNDVFMDQGLLARFLYVFPKKIEENTEEEEEYEVPEAIRMKYRSSLWELFSCTSPTVIPGEFSEDEDEGDRIELPEKKTIYFSPEATALWKGPLFRAQNQKEKWAELEGELIIKWTKRYRGTIGRIASVIHAFKLGADMTAELLDADTLTDAWRITDYFFETAKAAFSYSPAAPKIVNARYVWAKIKTAAPDKSGNITTRNLWRQQCHSKFKDEREDFDAALDELQKRGYIKRVRIQTEGRSSEILRINSEAIQD